MTDAASDAERDDDRVTEFYRDHYCKRRFGLFNGCFGYRCPEKKMCRAARGCVLIKEEKDDARELSRRRA